MLICCFYIFGFVHKILVIASTILVLTNNNWFKHWPNKEKKLSSSLINALRDLKAVNFTPEVTTGHYVRARASLVDKRIPVFLGLSCLLANAAKHDVMSDLTCSKTISGLLYDFNWSIWSIWRCKIIPTFSKFSKINHAKQNGLRITINSNLHSRVTLT